MGTFLLSLFAICCLQLNCQGANAQLRSPRWGTMLQFLPPNLFPTEEACSLFGNQQEATGWTCKQLSQDTSRALEESWLVIHPVTVPYLHWVAWGPPPHSLLPYCLQWPWEKTRCCLVPFFLNLIGSQTLTIPFSFFQRALVGIHLSPGNLVLFLFNRQQ